MRFGMNDKLQEYIITRFKEGLDLDVAFPAPYELYDFFKPEDITVSILNKKDGNELPEGANLQINLLVWLKPYEGDETGNARKLGFGCDTRLVEGG